jgi:16S rRNA (cytosine967-C5)-methyltransferase
MPAVSEARRAAFAILLSIERGTGHSDDLLRDNQLMARISDADRRLATTLVLGVLRWQIQLDDCVRRFLAGHNAKLDPAVLVALRMGAFQLLHLDRIPPHAAINESVELTKRSGYRSAAGLVNAVLRKVASACDASGTPRILKGHDFSHPANAAESMRASAPEGSSSPAVTAHPQWMIERWTRFFGAETACSICAHDQEQPATAIRLFTPAAEQELADTGIALSPGNLLTIARIVESGDFTDATAFREGRVRMQDEGSQLVGEIAAITGPGPEKILDCCAAPGGKTLILSERNPAARILACEVSPPRVRVLRERLAGLGDRVECKLADATVLSFDSEFDIVLADVPCSGTGTLSRNPEIRHRLRPDDLPRQAERQRSILASALRAVRPGGRVVYSTCSLEPEENEDVVAAVLAENANARVISLVIILDALRDRGILTESGAEQLPKCLTPEGFLRLIPGQFGTDGFFIAMIAKRAV